MKKVLGIIFLFIASTMLIACVDNADDTTLADVKAEFILEYADTLGSNTFEVTEDLNLITSFKDATIAWVSSDTDVVTNDGDVTRPEAGEDDATLTLTATITFDESSDDVVFNIVVLALEEDEPEMTFDYGVYNGDFEFNMQVWEYYQTNGFHDISTSMFQSGEKSLSVQNGSDLYTSIWQTIDINQTNGPQAGDFLTFSASFNADENMSGTVQLIVENVISPTNKVTLAQSEKTELMADTWTLVTSTVAEIPTDALEINIVMIFETEGVVYVDDATLTKTISNNALASSIYADDILLTGFQSSINTYDVYLPSEVLPVITADLDHETSTVDIIQAQSIDEQATVTITAEDGTINVYTINFMVASDTDLANIYINDESLLEFSATDYTYYVVLDSTDLPVVTYDTYFETSTVTLSTLETVPGLLEITVDNSTTSNVYSIYFDVVDDMAYDLANGDFESAFDWQVYTQDLVPTASNEQSHSGLYALLSYKSTSVWKELEYGNGLPSVGDAVKVGAWIYIDGDATSYDFTLKVVGYTEETGSKEVFSFVQINENTLVNEWVYIETLVSDINQSDRFQVVIENYTDVNVYVDDMTLVQGISSNAYLSDIRIDTVSLVDFDKDVVYYAVIEDDETISIVSADAVNPNATVEITQASELEGMATILVTAVDGTQMTYTVDFVAPSSGLLANIEIDGQDLVNFDPIKLTYYLTFDETTESFPTIVATATDENDLVEVVSGMLPGYATITVTTSNDDVTVYTIYGETANSNQLSTPYPDVSFDKNLENLGFSAGVSQSATQFLNGSKSLEMIGGEAWMGFGFDGTAYPVKGGAYSVGMWIYVEAGATGSFQVRLLEKDNNVELINESFTSSDEGHWIYIETSTSSAVVSDAAGYLQIVIANNTGVKVYVDAMRFIEQDAPVAVIEPIEDSVYDMPNTNLDMETSDQWGFWSPNNDGVAYATTIVNSGTQSLSFSEGSAWIGFGFDGTAYPAKGDTVKLGFYVYVDSQTASSVGGLTIKLVEKEGNVTGDGVVISYTTSDLEFAFDTWVYIETDAVMISNDPSYLQIVIEEGTDGMVYIDDITVIETMVA